MKRNNLIAQIALTTILGFLAILVVLPFIILISASLSNDETIAQYGYTVFPKVIDFTAYKEIFKDSTEILDAYKVTAIFSFGSMILSTVVTSLFAYPLSRKNFAPRQKLAFIIYFTTMFSGGTVPSYILITQWLKMDDTIWVYIIPGMFGVWNAFVMRTFFAGLPESIIESAYVDGASEYRILFNIVYPMSTPVLATIAVGTFLGQWNNWYTTMLYIEDPKLYSLQYLLQSTLKKAEEAKKQSSGTAANVIETNMSVVSSEAMRMAMAIVVAGPILFVFPFFQKYFVKGMVMGSVKG